MRFHYFQHVPFEGLGCIGQWLEDHKYRVSATKFYEHDHELPDLNMIDALIVIGGPMGVYDEGQYPWLIAEKNFIKACLKNNKKILGICLGAQLISVCLGGLVKPATNKEIGWFPLELTASCRKDVPWFYELLKDRPTLFHWHGDQFSIPSGAHDLAFTAGNGNQAFLYEERVLGLQFHLECTPKSLELMLDHIKPEDHEEYVQTSIEIRDHLHYCTQMNQLMDSIMDRIFFHQCRN